MNQDLFQKLPDVKPKDVFSILLYLIALPIAALYKRKRKHMWLLCEYGSEARDNAYYLYRYLREKKPQIDAVYAVKRRSIDLNRVRDLGEVVYYGSLKHWVYYLTAEVNISSQKGGKPNAAVCYFLEVVTGWLKNTRVFLQHGIIKDDLPFLHYDKTKLSLFMCSTIQEYRFVSNTFGYPKGSIVLTGLCRYDNLVDTSDGSCIAIMPTWREWLYKTHKMEKVEHTKEFTETTFYWVWVEAIKQILQELQKTDIKILLCLHRNMQQYTEYFRRINDRIQIVDLKNGDVIEVLKKASCLITDYSSVAIDFAYLRKPLAYYQADYEQFRLHHLPEGYFDYERDGFGEVCYSKEQLVEWLKKRKETAFKQEEIYQIRAEKFFVFHDDRYCERNFIAIRDLLEKKKGEKRSHG